MSFGNKKTYLPTLVFVLRRACVYIARYRHVMITYLPENGAALLDGVVLACEAFIAVADHPISE